MNKISVILIFFLIEPCCKKDESKEKLKPDEIIYNAYDSVTAISSVRSYFCNQQNTGCYYCIWLPWDSTAYFNIDIDLDNNFEFMVTVHHYQIQPARCVYYQYSIIIEGLSTDDLIRESSKEWIPEKLDTSIDISKNGKWTTSAYLSDVEHYNDNIEFKEMIIGLRKGNKYGWLHVKPFGSSDGICFIEQAINLTDNNSIKPGQKN
jgi:hypothetical protein